MNDFNEKLMKILPVEKQTYESRRKSITETLKTIAQKPLEKRTEIEQNLIKNFGKKYLKLEHIKVDGTWYWECPVCDKLLGATKVATEGYMKYHWKFYTNLQSKGVASKHLMKHEYSLVHHGRDVNKIANSQKSKGDN